MFMLGSYTSGGSCTFTCQPIASPVWEPLSFLSCGAQLAGCEADTKYRDEGLSMPAASMPQEAERLQRVPQSDTYANNTDQQQRHDADYVLNCTTANCHHS